MSYVKVSIERLITRKPMEEIQVEIEIQNELRYVLNRFQLLAIELGALLGNRDQSSCIG